MNTNFHLSEKHFTENFILLADDDEDDRYVMKEFFTNNGYPYRIVDSGKAAMHLLQSLSPDFYPAIILLDYTMPPLTGEEVLLLIKASEKLKQIPVIIYSSEMNEHLKSHLQSLGAYACFPKVFQSSQLNQMKEIIETLLSVKYEE